MTTDRRFLLLTALTSSLAFAQPTPPPELEDGLLSGAVEERLDAAGYTYLKVKTGTGSAWAAVPSAPAIKVGQRVSVQSQALMQAFESKTLKRTFPRIFFGTLSGGVGATAEAKPLPQGHPSPGPQPTLPPGHPTLPTEKPAAPSADLKTGAVVGTIEEVLQVPSYTYLRLATRGGVVWAAVQTTQAKVGDKVALQGSTVMENFESKVLKRRFERIYFASGLTPAPLSF